MEKVKAKEGDKVLSANCHKEKSALFLNKDRIKLGSTYRILKSN